MPESRVLNFTSCLRWLGLEMESERKPVEVGLKSPVTITIAFGCFEKYASKFFCIWPRSVTFSASPLAVEW